MKIGVHLVSLVACVAAQALHGQTAFDAGLDQRLQEALDEARSAMNGRGVAAAVHIPGFEPWTGASGSSHQGVPLRTDMRFFIGSITKTFTAAAVMQLIEAEKLRLDTTIGQALPGTLPAYVDPAITIEQLLSHTSGLYNYTSAAGSYHRVFSDLDRQWAPEDLLEDFLAAPGFAPGTRYQYSNTNYIVLGMILESATGSSASAEFERRFFRPFELDSAGLPIEDAIERSQFAHGFSSITSVAPGGDLLRLPSLTSFLSFFHTAGGAYMTADDLAVWTHALFSGGVVREVEEMMRLRFDSYGLGLMRTSIDGVELWGHGGLLFYHQAWTVHWPETGISIAVLTNDHADNAWSYLSPLLQVLREGKLPQSPRSPILSDRVFNGAPIALAVRAPVAAMPVRYELLSGSAEFRNGTLRPTGPGRIRLLATQSGNAFYQSATSHIEFDLFGLPPGGNGRESPPQVYREGQRLRLAVTIAEDGVAPLVERSLDLVNWEPLSSDPAFIWSENMQIHSFDLPSSGDRLFFRAR